MSETTANNKRIAKNTLLLYIRTLFLMLVSIYTSRVVLNTLGVVDYGIYNVIGGVVTMFTFINVALNSSTQRYLTYYIGINDNQSTQKVFVNCILIHVLIALIIVILSETIGLWFLLNKMVIPQERMKVAMWVYQFSIITTTLNIFCSPYNAVIIAHERMSIYATISILEAILKLLIVFLIDFSTWDKLLFYSLLLILAQLLIQSIYIIYCKTKFKETQLKNLFDRLLFKKLASFISWNVVGGISHVLCGQGINILLNMFFGPTVNAARGIAVQVQTAVLQFSYNFQKAINPQITKSYARKDLETMHTLIYRSSRYTFFLLLLIIIPVFIETDLILTIWLTIVPKWTVMFLRLILCVVVIDSVANPLMISSAATGDVRLYQSVIGGTMLLIVPTSYVFLRLGFNPAIVFIVHLFFCVLTFLIRIIIVKPMIKMSLDEYFGRVITPCLKTGFGAVLVPLMMYNILEKNTMNGIIIIIVSVLSTGIAIYTLGFSNSERNFVKSKLVIQKKIINRYEVVKKN